MAEICISFGQIHRHEINGIVLDKDCIAIIEADTIEEADQLAFLLFDGKFHEHVDIKKWDDSIMYHYPRGYIKVD